ncbi:MAG TPA: glutathione peroxidase [Solimonas sp.]|nr:glutathione peroxidase [Solimonas sp.]
MIKEGGKLPEAGLQVLEHGKVRKVSVAELFGGKAVVAFALPGAFTPTCSSQHLPRYEELAPLFRQHGIDSIVCLSVNDPYVMAQWGKDQKVREVRLIADGSGDFARAMGLLVDTQDKGMGQRSRRYSMLVRDQRVEKLWVEPDEPGDPFKVSDADTLLRHLAPEEHPPRVAVLSKPGCPHCASARRMLDEAGVHYTDLPLDDSTRSRVLGAVTGEVTAPQVFADGKRIGGTDALRAWLARRPAEAVAG